MSELTAFSLDDLELFQLTQDDTEMEVDVNFPFSPEFPATTGNELEGGHNVVYTARSQKYITNREFQQSCIVSSV